MANEQQIAANRRNAQKSTGPRSDAGKKRASGNAYRHGLAAGVGHSGKCAVQIETVALAIIGAATGWRDAATDTEILEFGRLAAKAELDIAHIRRIKAATMNSLMTSIGQIAAASQTAEAPVVAISGASERLSEGLPEPPAPPLLSPGPGQLRDTMRTSLAALATIDRYERRATARRDRAVLQLIARTIWIDAIKGCNRQNEPNSAFGISALHLVEEAQSDLARADPCRHR